jgi:hypothetical protein
MVHLLGFLGVFHAVVALIGHAGRHIMACGAGVGSC